MPFSSVFFAASLLLSTATSAFVVEKPTPVSRPSNCRVRSPQLFVSTSSTASTAAATTEKIPVHLLAGFLGSGKTTTLKHVLENTEGVRVGVIVNDVAAVNIDAKLVNRQENRADSARGEVIEMQNGCACCSLADELLGSIEKLLKNNRQFDAVLIELSGVADPVAIQNNWKQSVQQNLNPAVTEKAKLSNVITVVDACTFGTDYMSWDATGSRPGWVETADCVANRKVVELLAEQVEAASLIVINKQDLAEPSQVDITREMVRNLNGKAEIVATAFGKVSARQILKVQRAVCEDADCTDASHEHSHDHHASCEEPDCGDTSHSHTHDHAADASHSHDHATALSSTSSTCADPDCSDASHSHSHSHDHGASACGDPDCTDTSHSHSHDHQSSRSGNTSTDNLGISNFVYKAQRPFDAERLMQILYKWPVPIKNELDSELLKDASKSGYKIQGKKEDDEPSPFIGVLRSKGFCWFSPTRWEGPLEDTWRHNTAMYWSHAGKHLGVQEAGRFWASVSDAMMKEFFVDNEQEYDRVLREDFVSEEFGDRRQELVFIGVDLNEAAIRKALDECLLTEDEMATYRAKIAAIFDAVPVDV